MRCDGYCSDTVVATKSRRQRRRRETCRSFTCISPWFIFCRWFNAGRSRKGSRNGFMERKWEKEKMERSFHVKRISGIMKSSTNLEASSSSGPDVSAEIGKEATFNLGVGFGLMYLVAASRIELNKMVELHKKMELLLRNLQREVQNQEKKPIELPSKSRISSSFSNTDGFQEAQEHDSGQCLSSHEVEQPEIVFSSNRYRREKSLRMDQIEAELEAEFHRMHLQMDAEFPLKYSTQQYSEMDVEDSAPQWSLNVNTCFEEVNEQQEASYNEFYGVPPRELERKLHELLETRQQERINELESALDYAIEQVEEKERELSWWRDTASLICQHIPAFPGLLRQVIQTVHGMESESEAVETGTSLEESHM
ncbi:protein POLAR LOCALIZATION DURING ASYMMETRIC DIVISION AND REDISTRIBUTION [Sesamum alatum]|uniref:Protein POLAR LOCALIZATION DURING ASYMMETRIC DIVISION AND REDISTRIBUTION n=1 Tax=Sesamum alatum TaxID=300844 RepID=A0AAE2CV82_9LAMI|nr:protein POLAR LOCALIZATION DURING ASYMMETRIC DIVISION AND REDISTRIBUTION [Sesamum alatum]